MSLIGLLLLLGVVVVVGGVVGAIEGVRSHYTRTSR